MADYFELKERTMLTADGQAVPAYEPGGVRLLGIAGDRIPMAEAIEIGLTNKAAATAGKLTGKQARLARKATEEQAAKAAATADFDQAAGDTPEPPPAAPSKWWRRKTTTRGG